MKKLFPLFCLLFLAGIGAGQSISSAVDIWTVYSENGDYYLKSIPWDNEEPSLRGRTSVYRKSDNLHIYKINRGFDYANQNRLTLSNDGEIVFHVIDYGEDEEQDGLKSISVYKKGDLIASYSEPQITGCDYKKERCSLLYNNWEKVVDENSRGTGRIGFKQGVDAKEKFLFDYALFSAGNRVYLTDSKRKVHTFDLLSGKHLGFTDFDADFEKLQKIARKTEATEETFNAPTFLDFPKLLSGKITYEALAEKLGMKPYDIDNEKGEFKRYGFKISGYLSKSGSFEVEKISNFGGLPEQKITEFFTSNRFATNEIPVAAEKWFIRDEYFFFRNADDATARRERQAEINQEKEERKKLFVAETIGGRYIPKDLGECMIELDKELNEVNRKEISELKSRDEMSQYHMGLGMWLRNNWGLWGGSRLQKYFIDRGVDHPDNMSGVILDHYYDWLHGNKESWKEWEKKATKRKVPQRRKKNDR